MEYDWEAVVVSGVLLFITLSFVVILYGKICDGCLCGLVKSGYGVCGSQWMGCVFGG